MVPGYVYCIAGIFLYLIERKEFLRYNKIYNEEIQNVQAETFV